MGRRPPIPLGPFDLVRLIGKGGMGLVWQGKHRDSGLPVAVKTLRREAGDAESVSQFEAEVRAVAGLDHPGIVRVYDYGLVDEIAAVASADRLVAGSPYLAMELVDGGTVRQLQGNTTWPEVRDLVLAVLDALAHAHARRVIHRDLKPGNILLPGPKLTDFGIAQIVARDRTVADGSPDSFYGSPSFVAPEQIQVRLNEIGPWTDVYSLGCVVWKLTCGKPPYTAATALQVLQMHLQGSLPPYEPAIEVPAGFEEWLRRALRLRPSGRFQHATEAARALRAVEAEGTIDVRRLPTPADWRPSEPRPHPQRLEGAGLGLFGLRRAPVVGRYAERDRLWAALRIVTGRGITRAVVLRGGAGVGKSSLAEWLCDRAEELGLARAEKAVHGEARSQRDGAAPMIGRMLRAAGLPHQTVRWWAETRLKELGRNTPHLWDAVADLVVPGASPRPAPEEAAARATAAAYLGAEAGDTPLVLWFDDVHHGPDSLRLVADLLHRSRLQPRPILILLTLRDEALDPDSEAAAALAALEDNPAVATTRLDALDPDETQRLVEDLLGLEAGLASRVVDRAEGNPLFATQLVADWVARGVLLPDHERGGFSLAPGAEAAIPDGLHALWRTRTDRATSDDPEIRGALELAAALGAEVATGEWLLCCDRAGLVVPFGLVERLARDGLARHVPGGWAFAHGLLRESLERDAREGKRWPRYNAAIARQLASAPDPATRGRLVAALAETTDVVQSADAMLIAAREAMAAGDLDIAQGLVRRALERMNAGELGTDEPLRLEATLDRITIRRLQGRAEDVEASLQFVLAQAREAGRPALAARALREQGEAALEGGAPEVARQRFDEALIEAEDDDDRRGVAAATDGLARALLALRQPDAAGDAFRRAAAMHEALADPVNHGRALLAFAAVLAGEGEELRAAAARELAMDVLRRADAAGHAGAREAVEAAEEEDGAGDEATSEGGGDPAPPD